MLRLRRPDECVACGHPLAAGAQAWWNADARSVTCTGCASETSSDELTRLGDVRDRGQAGTSVTREHQRRRAAREARVRRSHPHIGGLLLALGSAPQHETAFARGAIGERRVGEVLEARTVDTPAIVLHDRRMPAGAGNIDHLAIAPTGAFIVDAKHYSGKVTVQRPLRGVPRLMIAGRDRSRLLKGLERQIIAVRHALTRVGCDAVPIQGVMCFTEADLPLIGTLQIRGHEMLYPKRLAKRLAARGPIEPDVIRMLAGEWTAAFPSA